MSSNPWILHVKKWSKLNNEAYSCAISNPKCKEAYYKKEVKPEVIKNKMKPSKVKPEVKLEVKPEVKLEAKPVVKPTKKLSEKEEAKQKALEDDQDDRLRKARTAKEQQLIIREMFRTARRR